MKRALITGITGNLGQAAQIVFERNSWDVVGISRTGGQDLTGWVNVYEFVATQDAFDLVFMTHGTQEMKLIKDFNPKAYHEIVGNNLLGAVILSSSLVRSDKLNEGALVVYCSSIQATQPRAGRGLYAIAKAGLEALTRSMAVELAPHQRAIALRLGQMEGTMKGITFPPEAEAAIKEYTPLPWVSFEDTARLVHHLYSQPSISGVVYEVNSLHHLSIWPK